ncbi:MAG: NAD-binding protein [Coxiellaceae bacterium]|nr:NAD-binding protein [Coxiellaceae bacterium]
MSRARSADPMVVIGGGAAGGVLANALAALGLEVVLIEMREMRLRPQVLSEMPYGFRRSLWYTTHIDIPAGYQQIKDVEKAIDVENAKKLSFDEAGNPCGKAGKICLYKPFKVIAVDRESFTVLIEHTETHERHEIPFKHVFFCEGESRQSVKWMDDPSISYIRRPYQPLHADFALAVFETPGIEHDGRRSLEFIEYLTPAEFLDILTQIKYLNDPDDADKKILAWDKPYLPIAYTIPHGTRKTKHKLNCEFLVDEPDPDRKRKLIAQWGKKLLHLLSKYCSASVEIAEADIHLLHTHDTPKGRAKYNLRLASTHVELDRIEEPSKPLTADASHCAVWVGGSAASAWFRNANGAQSAMMMALEAAQCLDPATGAWDVAAYAKKVGVIVTHADTWSKRTAEERALEVKQQSEKYEEAVAPLVM